MKKTIAFLTIAFLFLASTANAQLLSKKSLTSLLNDTGIPSMSSSEQSGMNTINNGLMSDLFKMDSKKQSKADRDSGIDRLFDKRDSDVDKLFGKNDNYLKKYKKEFRKKSRGLRTKIKLAKLVL